MIEKVLKRFNTTNITIEQLEQMLSMDKRFRVVYDHNDFDLIVNLFQKYKTRDFPSLKNKNSVDVKEGYALFYHDIHHNFTYGDIYCMGDHDFDTYFLIDGFDVDL
jgi:hypothetical protein